MTCRAWMFSAVLALMIISIITGVGFSQGPSQGQGTAAGKRQQTERRITMQGKIYFNKDLNSYVVERKNPFYVYMILNQDKAVLAGFEKEAKTYEVEGTQPHGADFLFIETIDGKKYP